MAQTQAQAIRFANGENVDYTPASAVYAGDVIVLSGGLVGVATQDIPANTLGALAVTGSFKVPKKTGAISVGDSVYWTPTGDPVTGTAGTGAAGAQTSTGTFMGVAILAAASGDSYVNVNLSRRPKVSSVTVTAAGSVQGDAVALNEGINLVNGADATKGAILTAGTGLVYVKNSDAADAVLKVYPPTGATINALSANGAISMGKKTSAVFAEVSSTAWVTIPLLPS